MAASAAETVQDAHVVITMPPTADVVNSVIFAGGVAQALADGAVWAQMGTIGLTATTEIGSRLGQLRPVVTFVDAPVSGSKGPAQSGQLLILASGPPRSRPCARCSRRSGPSGIGRSALTCEDAYAGTGCERPSATLAMQEVKDHLQDRNILLNCRNVELRGFESLTSCRPYGRRPSPCTPKTCGVRGPMWPDVALRLPLLAPNLAPRQLVSAANVRSPDSSQITSRRTTRRRTGTAAPRTSRRPSPRYERSSPRAPDHPPREEQLSRYRCSGISRR